MSKPRTRPAFTLFFPLAALLAAVAVPLSMFAMLSGTGWPAGLVGVGHGFELIFGFALALIAGYTLRSEEHTSELQSRPHLVCRLLLEKKKKKKYNNIRETASSPNKNQTFRRTSSSRS